MSPARLETPAFAVKELLKVVETDAHEGPCYVPEEEALYFTTVPRPGPRVDIRRVDLASGHVFPVRADANVANGMTLDHEGRLLVCEQGTRSQHATVTRVERASGAVEVVVDDRLNSPNDVIVRSDGSIWFTDPSYGYLQGFRTQPERPDAVYRYDGELTIVADSFDKPNGLAFSPDESVLYVGDSGANQEPGSFYPERPHHIKAFDVVDGRQLTNERLFAGISPGFPDGIKVDSQGRVYSSCASGVQVFEPDGSLTGEIELPGAVNFTFGGPDRNVLYITADDAIWAGVLTANGPPTPKGA